MRYIIYKDDKIVGIHEQDPNILTLQYPGYKVKPVKLGDEIWKDLSRSPEKYIYKDGKVVLLAQKE